MFPNASSLRSWDTFLYLQGKDEGRGAVYFCAMPGAEEYTVSKCTDAGLSYIPLGTYEKFSV
jgi:hypothetical protein